MQKLPVSFYIFRLPETLSFAALSIYLRHRTRREVGRTSQQLREITSQSISQMGFNEKCAKMHWFEQWFLFKLLWLSSIFPCWDRQSSTSVATIFSPLAILDSVGELQWHDGTLSDPWCQLQTSCISAEFFLSITDFFLSFTPGHLCISPVCSE